MVIRILICYIFDYSGGVWRFFEFHFFPNLRKCKPKHLGQWTRYKLYLFSILVSEMVLIDSNMWKTKIVKKVFVFHLTKNSHINIAATRHVKVHMHRRKKMHISCSLMINVVQLAYIDFLDLVRITWFIHTYTRVQNVWSGRPVYE